MKVFALALLSLLASPGHSWADSTIAMEQRNVLRTHGPLSPGEELVFPKNYHLDFNKERALATDLVTGSDSKGHPYACAMAISAEIEVSFPEITHWSVASISADGDVQKLVLFHEQWGSARPLEFRCTENADMNAVLDSRGIKLFEEIPVEMIDDHVPVPGELEEAPNL
jgi:hypothetical protein